MTERKNPVRNGILCAFLLMIASVSAIEGMEATAFSDIFGHYEAIRQALIEDSTEGVAEHARAISAAAARLERDFTASAAGVDSGDAAAVKELLPLIEERSMKVASAPDIASIRTEFAVLTKPLVRYHALVQGSRPVVAYCPMEKRAWLQPDEPIGNPYAPNMLRCGEVVQR